MDKKVIPTGVVYSLNDPDTLEIRYIGKTTNPSLRLYGHTSGKSKAKCGLWVMDLVKEGKMPIMKIIETCPFFKLREREAFHIVRLKQEGCSLLNVYSGHYMQRSNYNFEFPLDAQSKIEEICFLAGMHKTHFFQKAIDHYYEFMKKQF